MQWLPVKRTAHPGLRWMGWLHSFLSNQTLTHLLHCYGSAILLLYVAYMEYFPPCLSVSQLGHSHLKIFLRSSFYTSLMLSIMEWASMKCQILCFVTGQLYFTSESQTVRLTLRSGCSIHCLLFFLAGKKRSRGVQFLAAFFRSRSLLGAPSHYTHEKFLIRLTFLIVTERSETRSTSKYNIMNWYVLEAWCSWCAANMINAVRKFQ